MGKIQKGVNIIIDCLGGIIVIIMGYQYYIGNVSEGSTIGMVVAGSVVIAIACWILKTMTGLFTRPLDALQHKVNKLKVED